MADLAPRPPPMVPSRPAGPPDSARRRPVPELGPLRRAAGFSEAGGDRERDLSQVDNMWDILHGKEQSPSPRLSPVEASVGPLMPPRHRSVPSRAVDSYNPGAFVSPRWDPVPGPDFSKAGLFRPHIVGVEAGTVQESAGWLERRLETAQADQRADLAQRFGAFEQGDRRFKDWVQRENEQLTGQLQQLKAAAIDGQQAHQRQTEALTTQCHRLERRIQDLDSELIQANAQAQSLAHAVQTTGAQVTNLAGSAAGGTPLPLLIEGLRADLDREISARGAIGEEAMAKIGELHQLVAQVSSRQERALVEHTAQREAKLATVGDGVAAGVAQLETLRLELEGVREQLARTDSQCSQRCQEIETACSQRMAGVQEDALAAVRELWEEHRGMFSECKSSVASLQQILDAKDKLAAQLQQIQQQQRQDDRQSFVEQLQHGLQALQGRVRELETLTTSEKKTRSEAQQQVDTHLQRLGQALETAQAGWLQDADKMQTALKEARRQLESKLGREGRDWERRLEEAVCASQRRLEALDAASSAAQAAAHIAEEHLAELARSQETGFRELEDRLERQLVDSQSLQGSRLSKCEFDLRALLRDAVTEQTGRARQELAQGLKETELWNARLREDVDARFTMAEEASVRLAANVDEMIARLQADVSTNNRQVRAYAEQLAQEVQGAAAVSLGIARKDLSEQVKAIQQICADVGREVENAEARLAGADDALEARLQARISDEQRITWGACQEEMQGLVQEERGCRLKAEAERSEALQQRFGSLEELLGQQLQDIKARQEDALSAHRDRVEAQLSEASLARERFIEEVTNQQQMAAASIEEALAALSAKLAVGRAVASSELRLGLASVEDQIASGLAAASSTSAGQRAQLREELHTEVARIESDLSALREEDRTARETFLTAMREAREATEAAVQGALSEAQAALQSESAEAAERLRRVREHLVSLEEDVLKRAKDLSDSVNDQEGALGDLRRQLRELGSQLEEAKAELGLASQERATEAAAEVAAQAEAANAALEVKLLGDIDEAEDQRLALGKRVEELAARLQAEEGRAVSAEAVLTMDVKVHQDAFQARVEQLAEELSQQRDQATKALRDGLGVQEEALRVERDRADAAEQALRGKLEEQSEINGKAFDEVRAASRTLVEALQGEDRAIRELVEQQRQRLDESASGARMQLEAKFGQQEQSTSALRVELQSSVAGLEENIRKLTVLQTEQGEKAAKDLGEVRAEADAANRSAMQEAREALHAESEEATARIRTLREEVFDHITNLDQEPAMVSLRENLDQLGSRLASAEEAAAEAVAKARSDLEKQSKDLQAQVTSLADAEAALQDAVVLNEKQAEGRAHNLQSTLDELSKVQAEDRDVSARNAKQAEERAQGILDMLEVMKQSQAEDHDAITINAKYSQESSQNLQRVLDELKDSSVLFQTNQADTNELQKTVNSNLEMQSNALEELLKEMAASQAREREATAEEIRGLGEGMQDLRSIHEGLRLKSADFEAIQADKNKLYAQAYTDLERRSTDLEDQVRALGKDLAQTRDNADKDAKSTEESLEDLRKSLAKVEQAGVEFKAAQEDINKLQAKATGTLEGRSSDLEEQLQQVKSLYLVGAQDAKRAGEGLEDLRKALDKVEQAGVDFQRSQEDTNKHQAQANADVEKRWHDAEEQIRAAAEQVRELEASAQRQAKQATEGSQDLQAMLQELKQAHAQFQSSQEETNEVHKKTQEDLERRSGDLELHLKELAAKQVQDLAGLATIGDGLTDVGKRQEDLEKRSGDLELQLKELAAKQAQDSAGLATIGDGLNALDNRHAELQLQHKNLAAKHDEESKLRTDERASAVQETKTISDEVQAIRTMLEVHKQMSQQFQASQESANEAKSKSGADLESRAKELEERLGRVEVNQTKQSEAGAKSGADLESRAKELDERLGRVEVNQTKQSEAGADTLVDLRKTLDELRQGQEASAATIQEFKNKGDGMQEQLATLVETSADLMGQVKHCASSEAVQKLRRRIDGSVDNLLVRIESERWLRENVDRTADTITNSFLRLVDESNSKLKDRVQNVEQKVQQSGTA